MSESAAAAGSAGQTTETTQAPGGQPSGMPQFRFESWPGQIVWALIIFVVLYLVLARGLLPRVGRTMEARDQKIHGDMAEARALRDQAEAEAKAAEAEMNEARAKAARTASEAKARSAAEAAERQGALEAQLGEKLAAAEDQIRASRDQAMGQVQSIAVDAAQAIAEKLTGQAATAAEVEQALAKA